LALSRYIKSSRVLPLFFEYNCELAIQRREIALPGRLAGVGFGQPGNEEPNVEESSGKNGCEEAFNRGPLPYSIGDLR